MAVTQSDDAAEEQETDSSATQSDGFRLDTFENYVHGDAEDPLDELTYTDLSTLKVCLRSLIKRNAESIKKRRKQNWKENPATEHIVSQRNRRAAKMYHRIMEVKN